MASDFLNRCIRSLIIPFLVATKASSAGAVDRSGAVVGFLLMAINNIVSHRFGGLIIFLFSTLTPWGNHVNDNGRPRWNWLHVLANTATATVLVVWIGTMTGLEDRCLDANESRLITSLIGAVIGHYACCTAITWSSEFERLIRVPPQDQRDHVDGRVSGKGLIIASAAGCSVGSVFALMGTGTTKCARDDPLQLSVICVATMAGQFGRLVFTFLSRASHGRGKKHALDFVSAMSTALVTALACGYVFS